ncbi:MFS transporter [Leucobacter sp. NPDC058333]|uniref:MFS transporter n=1 Tax=Leucobacter sp. NPDC058333 TaxID=3346450 RepID=UPI00365ED105
MSRASQLIAAPPSPSQPTRNNPVRVAAATLLGTSAEWYDYGIYAFAAAVIFPSVFFPDMPGPLGVFASFVTIAVGSLARPIGAAVFGHIGDRYGRRKSLVASLLIMGIATIVIGLLPGFATLGYLAPVLLLLIRLLQSFAAGGEWGGAVLFAIEAAPKRWRALFGSFPQMGSGVGFFLATGAFSLVALFGDDALLAWAWRLPFFASIALVAIGLIVRSQLDETEVFVKAEAAQSASERKQLPLFNVLRSSWGVLLLAIGGFLITIGGFYIVTSFFSAYAAEQLHLSAGDIANAGVVASIIAIVTVPPAAIAADKWGVRTVTLIGLGLHVVGAYPIFMLLQSGTVGGLYAAMSLGMAISVVAYAPISTLVAGWFSTPVRQTGISLGYQISGVIGGGLTLPLVQALQIRFDSVFPVMLFFAGMGLLSFMCVLLKRGPGHLSFGDRASAGATEELEVVADVA